jgi:DNA (cytosine-5)-methyltransferase 1
MTWLISNALMNSLCLQEQGAASLAENFSDGEQSAPLNGNPIQQAYCAPDKMTDFSRLSRFGMTYKPLTENLGQELLTLYLADFHAKTLAPQEKAQELTESGQECGEKWRASFTKYDHDSSLWRTHQCSLLGDLEPFLETWPQWGLMRDGECWEQLTLERHIRGTESGLSPNGVDSFHTPNTTGLDGGSNSRKALKKRQHNWPTPVKSDYAARRPSKGWQGNSDLPSVVWTETGGRENPTMPPAQLNATWVEWLMGWPLGWTDLKPLGTDKSHSVPPQLGNC